MGIHPRAAVGDKGYDSKATRAANRRRIDAVIRYKSNAKDRPTFFANLLNKARVRIEQPVGKLKRF